jgi:hypothetical protein
MFLSHGYRFFVMGDRRRGGQLMVSLLGIHACFIPPSSRAGPVSPQRLMERVEEKVRSYRRLAETYEVPLVVAVGAHRFTGVTFQHVDDMLNRSACPEDHLSVRPWGPYVGEQAVSTAPVPPWQWPEDLASLLWIDSQLPFKLTPRPNPTASRQMPRALLLEAPSRSQ